MENDADGLLISAGALQIQRDPATGFVTGSALRGATESRTYDAYGAEANYAASLGGSSFYSVTYMRDALGRITSLVSPDIFNSAAHEGFSEYGRGFGEDASHIAKDIFAGLTYGLPDTTEAEDAIRACYWYSKQGPVEIRWRSRCAGCS